MKQQMNLVELATELERQRAVKADYVAASNSLGMTAAAELQLPVPGNAGDVSILPMRDHAHGQMAARLDIPQRYYNRMKAANPELLMANVNAWLHRSDDRRLIRVMDGNVRAILSDRYQRIENQEIAEVALPVLAAQPDMHIVSAAITDTRLYIKAVFPRIGGEARVGDPVQSGVIISNSEVGAGAVSVAPFVYTLRCTNGMVVPDSRIRGFHIGGRAAEGEAVYQLLSDETKRADDKAILLKLRDVVRAAADQAVFDKVVARLRESTEEKVTGNVVKAVDTLGQVAKLSAEETGGILRRLIEGADLSRYGLLNAVTRHSQDVADYDRASELESIGGQVLNLPRDQWRRIAEAA